VRRLSDDLSTPRLAISASSGNTFRKTFYCGAAERCSGGRGADFALKASAFIHVTVLKTALAGFFYAPRYADIV
jgi:hypothetical protein